VGVIALWIQGVDGRPEVLAAGLLAALAMGLQSMATVPEAAFHARSHMAPSVRGQVLGRVVLVAACGGLLLAGAGVLAIFVAQVLDAVATLALILWNYRKHIGFEGMRTDRRAIGALIKEAFPFGMNALFGSIYLSVDVLLLQVMKGDEAVGLYRGAVMLIALFPVLANTLTTGIYPRMARHLGDRVAAGVELAFASRILLVVSLPAAVGGFLVAEDLMVFLGGDDFARSALPFMIMAPLLPLRFLNNGFAMTLSTLNRQGDRTRGVMIAAALNLGLNFIFIPKYGAAGAAGTTVATEVVLLAWNRWRIAPLVQGLGLGGSLLRVGVAAALMGAAVMAVPELHVVLDISVGVIVFAVVSRLSGAWARRDLGRLRRV
jgi:O-antigen/teichoic acid export membrane protein